MDRREFVQLSQVYEGQSNIYAWYFSVKLDGFRAIWDGGITRGMETKDIPWSNTEREDRYRVIPKSTGLWSRYGRPIQAPSWWLDQLPDFCLDGELWIDRGQFQRTMSITKQLEPNDIDWEDVKYMVFDSPNYREWLANGEIRIKGKFEKKLVGCVEWALARAKTKIPEFLWKGKTFDDTVELLKCELRETSNIQLHEQERLPYDPHEARAAVMEWANKEVEVGGEGGMIRMGTSFWVPKRTRTLLKVKPYRDGEGTVVGYTWGKETELGSKLLGLMGSIEVLWNGIRFSLSGFTEAERAMIDKSTGQYPKEGINNPGKTVSNNVENPLFPRGSKIKFQYRELTDSQIPKEARYLRNVNP